MTNWNSIPVGDAEIELVLSTHDMSMSDDPTIAASGRLLKLATPMIMEWMATELERGTHPNEVLVAFNRFLTGSTIAVVGSICCATDAPAGEWELIGREMLRLVTKKVSEGLSQADNLKRRAEAEARKART